MRRFPDDEVKCQKLLLSLEILKKPIGEANRRKLSWPHFIPVGKFVCSLQKLLSRYEKGQRKTSVIFWACPVLSPGFQEALNMDTTTQGAGFNY